MHGAAFHVTMAGALALTALSIRACPAPPPAPEPPAALCDPVLCPMRTRCPVCPPCPMPGDCPPPPRARTCPPRLPAQQSDTLPFPGPDDTLPASRAP